MRAAIELTGFRNEAERVYTTSVKPEQQDAPVV